MVCYHHTDRPAVAVCKHCYKAVCMECAIPDAAGFTCSEKCHREIAAISVMMEKSKTMYGMKPGRFPVTPVFLLLAGIPFLLLGLLTLSSGEAFGLFTTTMGIIFIGLGIASYISYKKTGIKS